MYYWPIYHFYVETRSLKKFISVNKLLFARHYRLAARHFVPFAFALHVRCGPLEKTNELHN